MTDDQLDVGFFDRLKEALGVTRGTEIADKLGMSNTAVSKWKKGGPISVKSLRLISEKTNCNLHWLITGKGSKHIEFRPGLFIELNDFQKQEIKRIARNSNVTPEEQLTRIIIWALLFFEVMTQKQPSQSTFEAIIKWMHDLADSQPVESQIRNTR